MKKYGYVVEGDPLQFPFDMLRYDGSYPAREEDAVILAHIPRTKPCTTVRIALIGTRPPSWKRWETFGWTVVNKANCDKCE